MKTPEERFWAKVAKGDGCWEWTASRARNGVGYFYDGERVGYAPRFAWRLANGQIPDGLEVCHRCDNPPCVRIDHLFLGTHRENVEDMARKGRGKGGTAFHEPGCTCGNHKGQSKPPVTMLPAVVEEVRTLAADGLSSRAIGARLGVSHTSVQKVMRLKPASRVDGEEARSS